MLTWVQDVYHQLQDRKIEAKLKSSLKYFKKAIYTPLFDKAMGWDYDDNFLLCAWSVCKSDYKFMQVYLKVQEQAQKDSINYQLKNLKE